MKILVTGATGFLGRHLIPLLRVNYKSEDIFTVSSKDYDLTAPQAVKAMFSELKPDVVIHLAALSGGIGVNIERPADFFFINNQLMTLVFEYAAKNNVKKLIYTMGGCSYPAKAKSPINEEQMWDGFPQKESSAYSSAKKMGIIASQSYRNQYGLNSVVLIPGNMYGEYDNFKNGESHVIPALLRRYHEAKINNKDEVVMWGTGKPTRDFVYAGDVAKSILHFIENYNLSEPINISTGTSVSIKELAEEIKNITGYTGKITWDETKPDGQMIKIFDVSRLKDLGISCSTPLSAGLKKTYHWFENNFTNETDGIRL